jgi:hypothetical protein
MDELQYVFFDLALANTRRTEHMCRHPEGLAVWALEILKDMAEQALKYVKEYDAGELGLAEVGVARGGPLV